MQALPGSRKGAISLFSEPLTLFSSLFVEPKLKISPLLLLASKELPFERRIVSLAPENTLSCFGEKLSPFFPSLLIFFLNSL